MTVDVKYKKFMAVNREAMEEVLKALNVEAKVLARRSNAMWDILLVSKEVAKTLAGNTLTTKTMRLQTEYMDTQKTRITLHWVPMYITEDHLGAFFAEYAPVDEVSSIKSKSGIFTGDFEVLVTLTRPKFNEVPNIITCGGRNIFVVVEGRCRSCWGCDATGQLAKLCPIKKPTPQTQTTLEQPKEEAIKKDTSSLGEWTGIVRRGGKG